MFKELEPTISEKIATKMLSRIVALFISLFMLVAATPGIVGAEKTELEEGWQFTVEPYMWAASIGVTTASGSDVDIDFNDIIDNLEMTFMGVFGARKGKLSLLADVIYLNIEDGAQGTSSIPIGQRSLAISTDVNVELSSWIVTPAVSYNVMQTEKASLDIVGGARYLWLKADVKLKVSGPLGGTRELRIIESGHVWDGIVGVRGQVNLAEKWYLPYYADLGTGDSDLTWQAIAGLGYRFNSFDLVIGYRYIDWEFDDSSVFEDMNVSGPYAGFKFVF